jgi:CubicO group peptidase (beta-lactamase class C family)
MPDDLTHDALPRARPETRGVASRSLGQFLDAVRRESIELHSLMVMRSGAVIAEGWWHPYRPDLPHMQHSLTKSFTAAGVGLAEAEGLLRLDDRVVSFFPDDLPDRVDANLADMTVRDLLTMRTGHHEGIPGSAWRRLRGSWVRAFFNTPVAEPPGTRFVYNSAASYMLSAIVQKQSGECLHDYLTSRLLRPIGVAGLTWERCPAGINPGGNAMSCRTEDMLRFASLHLQDGVWQGRRLLPAGWVRHATTPVVTLPVDEAVVHLPGTPVARGYGLHWWTGPEGAYFASGMFGQYAIVLPAYDTVLAVTAGIPLHDERLLDLVWRDLCPMLGDATAPMPDTTQSDALATRLARLSLLPISDTVPGATSARRLCFRMAPNEDDVRDVVFDFDSHGCRFSLADARGVHRIHAADTHWHDGMTTMPGERLHHAYQPERLRVAASMRWLDPATCMMTWRFVETAFCDTLTCRFTPNGVAIDRRVNVNSGPLFRPTLHGVLPQRS